jgi:hypothetical protein
VISDAGRAELERQLGKWRSFTGGITRLIGGEGAER